MTSDRVYHVTPRCNLPSIMSEGLRPGSSWWCCREKAETFCEEISRERENPVLVSATLADISAAAGRNGLAPDKDMLSAPMIEIVGKGPDEIMEEWAGSSGGWRDSAKIVGAFSSLVNIHPMYFVVEEPYPKRETPENDDSDELSP